MPLSTLPVIAKMWVRWPWMSVPFPEFRLAFDTAMKLASAGESPQAAIQAQLGKCADPFLSAVSTELSSVTGSNIDLNKPPNKKLMHFAAEFITKK